MSELSIEELSEYSSEYLAKALFDCRTLADSFGKRITTLQQENSQMRDLSESRQERVLELIEENEKLLVQRDREHKLIHEMKEEISSLKMTVNNLRQKVEKLSGERDKRIDKAYKNGHKAGWNAATNDINEVEI